VTTPVGEVCWCGHGIGSHGGRWMLGYCMVAWCTCANAGGYESRESYAARGFVPRTAADNADERERYLKVYGRRRGTITP
jgi:hypothetical protein